MTTKNRRKHTPAFKAKVALAAIKGERLGQPVMEGVIKPTSFIELPSRAHQCIEVESNSYWSDLISHSSDRSGFRWFSGLNQLREITGSSWKSTAPRLPQMAVCSSLLQTNPDERD